MESRKVEFNLISHIFLQVYYAAVSLDRNSHNFCFKGKIRWSLVLLPHSWQFHRALAVLEGDVLPCRTALSRTVRKSYQNEITPQSPAAPPWQNSWFILQQSVLAWAAWSSCCWHEGFGTAAANPRVFPDNKQIAVCCWSPHSRSGVSLQLTLVCVDSCRKIIFVLLRQILVSRTTW